MALSDLNLDKRLGKETYSVSVTEKRKGPFLVVFKILFFAILLNSFSGCAAYRFGNQSLFPANIKTVHVAMFENDTFRSGLGEWLTEGVIKEVQDRTPFQLASPSNADSFLRGKLVRTQKNFAIENAFDEGRDIAYLNQVEITWTDRTGMPLTTSQKITLTEDANFIPESGQSLTTAQLELIQRLSRQIVNQMETSW